MLKLIAIIAALSAPVSMIDGLNEYRESIGQSKLERNSELMMIASIGASSPETIGRWLGPMIRLRKLPSFGYIWIATDTKLGFSDEEMLNDALNTPVVQKLLKIKAPCKYGIHKKANIMVTIIACSDPRNHREI